MKTRHITEAYLPIAVAGVIVGILAVYSIDVNQYQRILVYILGGAIILAGFLISEKIKSSVKRAR
jgi:hypothetical protein